MIRNQITIHLDVDATVAIVACTKNSFTLEIRLSQNVTPDVHRDQINKVLCAIRDRITEDQEQQDRLRAADVKSG